MKIGFIGCGKMGGSILSKINGKVFATEDILVYELNEEIKNNLKKQGVMVVGALQDLTVCDVLLIAVKPQDFNALLENMKSFASGKVIISIAAGIKISTIEKVIQGAKVARVMPNTAALIGEASSVISFNERVENSEKELVIDIINAIGKSAIIDESLMDEVIPIGGSFTAFQYYFYKGFLESSLKRGVPFDVCKRLLVQSIIGSAKMIESSEKDIDALISDVCSKGGTTLAGLKEFEDNNLLEIIDKCAVSCRNRSEELGKN